MPRCAEPSCPHFQDISLVNPQNRKLGSCALGGLSMIEVNEQSRSTQNPKNCSKARKLTPTVLAVRALSLPQPRRGSSSWGGTLLPPRV